MIVIALCCAGLSIALAFWIGQQLFTRAMESYRQTFTQETGAGLRELFVFVDPSRLWPILVCLSAGSALLCWVVSRSEVLALLCASAALLLPRFALAKAVRSRLARLDAQLPDALLAMGATLRSGASLGVALRALVQDADAPLCQEFGLVLREQRMGVTLATALLNLNHRMPSESIQITTTLLRVAAASGGSLADLLERLSETLRARQHLGMKIDVLTSQGKLQGWIIGALPLVLLVVLSQVDPYSVGILFNTQAGQMVLGVIIVLECSGIFLLRRILAICP